MGKSFNDRNRKKGAERAYRRTKKSDKRGSSGRDKEDWYASPERRDSSGQQANTGN